MNSFIHRVSSPSMPCLDDINNQEEQQVSWLNQTVQFTPDGHHWLLDTCKSCLVRKLGNFISLHCWDSVVCVYNYHDESTSASQPSLRAYKRAWSRVTRTEQSWWLSFFSDTPDSDQEWSVTDIDTNDDENDVNSNWCSNLWIIVFVVSCCRIAWVIRSQVWSVITVRPELWCDNLQ